MFAAHYQNEMLYNSVFFAIYFMVLITFHAYTEPIQRLIMKIRHFSMILNTMQLIILQFSRMKDRDLYKLNIILI